MTNNENNGKKIQKNNPPVEGWAMFLVVFIGLLISGNFNEIISFNNINPSPQEQKQIVINTFSQSDITEDKVTKIVSNILGETKSMLYTQIKEEQKDKYIIDVTFYPRGIANEKDFFNTISQKICNIMQILFSNNKVNKVCFSINNLKQTIFNVTLTNKTARKIDWQHCNNYKDLFTIADSSFIEPEIAKELL